MVAWDELQPVTAPRRAAPASSAPPSWDSLAPVTPKPAEGTMRDMASPRAAFVNKGAGGANAAFEAPAKRGWWEHLKDSASDMASQAGEGINALVQRVGGTIATDDVIDHEVKRGALTPEQADQARVATAQAANANVAEVRAQHAIRDAADPAWRPGAGIAGNIGRTVASFAGGVAGDVNPTYAIGGEAIPVAKALAPVAARFAAPIVERALPAAGRVVSQGLTQVGVDAGTQSLEINEGTQAGFDPSRSATAFAGGAGLQALGETAKVAIPALRTWWRSRGVNPDTMTDEAVIQASAADPHPDVQAILAKAGYKPEQFTDPGAMAERVQAAQSRRGVQMADPRAANPVPSADAERARQAGIHTDIEAGVTDPSLAPTPQPRTVPDSATVIGTPEGGAFVSEPGAHAGHEQQRAAEAHTDARAIEAAKTDPTMDFILNSSLDDATKRRMAHERLAKADVAPAAPPEGVMRAPDQSGNAPPRDQPYNYDPAGKPNGDAPDTGNMGRAEDVAKPEQPRPAGFQGDGAGDSSRPFKTDPNDPNAATFEAEAKARQKAAYDDMTARWEQRAADEAVAAKNRKAGETFNDGRGNTADASTAHGGKYDQKPHKDGETWRTTADGYVAGKDGRPVAFRNHREAARFAADNELGGDFGLESWGATSTREKGSGRVVLKKREGSEYGQARPEAPRDPTPGEPRALPDTTGGEPRAPFVREAPRALHPDKLGDGPLPERAPRQQYDERNPPPPTPEAAAMAHAAEPDLPAPDPVLPVSRPPLTNEFADAKGNRPRQDPGFLSRIKAEFNKPGQKPRRISYAEAENNGIDIDTVKARPDLRQIFASDRPVRGKDPRRISQPGDYNWVTLDSLGDSIAPEDWHGHEHTRGNDIAGNERLSPEQVAKFFNDDPMPTGDRADRIVNYDRLQEDIDAFYHRYGNDADTLTDAQLRALDNDGVVEDVHTAMDDAAAHPDTYVGDEAWSPDHDGSSNAQRADQPREAPRAGRDDPGASEPAPEERGAGAAGDADGPVRGGERDSFGTKPDAQRDAFGTTDAERRAKLERDAEGRQGNGKTQRADAGPMFDDTGKQADWVSGVKEARGRVPRIENPKVKEAYDTLRAELDRLGLEDVSLKIGGQSLFSQGTYRYAEQLINVAMMAPEKMLGVLHHEAVHALRDMDLFTHAEWSALENAAKSRIGLRLATEPNYLHLNSAERTEEVVAQMVREHLRDKSRDGIVARVATRIKKFFDAMRSAFTRAGFKSAEDVMDAIGRGDIGAREASPNPDFVARGAHDMLYSNPMFDPELWKKLGAALVDTDRVKQLGADMGKALRGLKSSTAMGIVHKALDLASKAGRPFASFYAGNDFRLRGMAMRFKSPTFTKIADMFESRAGRADGTGRTYHEAMHFQQRRLGQAMFKAVEPHLGDPAAMQRIRDALTGKRGKLSPTESATMATVKKLLEDIHAYRREAGEDLGKVADYFPRVLDPALVAKGMPEFTKAATKLYQELGHSADDAAEMAVAWGRRVFNEHAGVDGSLLDVRRAKAPGTTSGKERILGARADALLSKFYMEDAYDVLQSYVQGSVKRAEYTRRFGRDGAEGSAKRAAWDAAHPGKTKLQVMERDLQHEMTASGKDPADTMDLLNTILESNLGILGKVSPNVRLSIGLAHAWNQLGKMSHVAVTSMTELAMGFARSGDLATGSKFVVDVLHEFGRAIARMEPSDAARYAEGLGEIVDATMESAQASRASADSVPGAISETMGKFYRLVGIHQLTNSQRIASVKMGVHLLNTFVGDLESSSTRTKVRAQRSLAELGITDHAGFAAYMKKQAGRPSLAEIAGDRGHAADFNTAIGRIVSETTIAPTAGQKPTWAGHPVGSLAYGLMGYSYGFKYKVLDRMAATAQRAFKERDPAQLMFAALGLPAILAMTHLSDTYVRPKLFGSGYDYDAEDSKTMAIRLASRANLFGALDPLVQYFYGTKYKREFLQTFSGSVVGSAFGGLDTMMKVKNANSEGTNTAERNAAGALYDLTIAPLIGGVAARYVGGPLGVAAAMTSNTRKGAAIGSPREAFLTALAGEDERPTQAGAGGVDSWDNKTAAKAAW